MANILQVTQPTIPNDHRSGLESQAAKGQAQNKQIQNPVDPSRVVRADGRQDGRTGTATGEGRTAVIDYESNYGSFVQRMNGSPGLVGVLDQLFFEDKAGYLLPDQGVMGMLLEQLRSSFQMETPQQLLAFFMGQEALQAKFSGNLFQNLRNLLAQNTSESLKGMILAFLKGYNNHSSGAHLLEQMRSTADTISNQMLSQFRDEFQGLLERMNWDAANGDTEGNTSLLNDTIIPFLSKYISRTHDYGAVRDSVMLFILHAVKYENGSDASLDQLLERLLGSKEFMALYEGDVQSDLQAAMDKAAGNEPEAFFADKFSQFLELGSKGGAGLENIQQYYTAFQGFLLNESVYMPLLHFLVPFTYQGTDVMSEVWVDPDAESEQEGGGRKIKMMFKFHIQQLGNFDMALEFQDRKTNLQLYVPPALQSKAEEIQEDISGIFRRNGIVPNRLMVREKRGELRVGDIFPEIREKERTINVSI